MCGIAGIYAYHATAPAVDRLELERIRDHMQARGPDGRGAWYSADARLGLAHRRLSIIDLSERAAQPMASADGRLHITFNGEIYNYRALRTGLEAAGRRFHSDSDTEVLLHLYAEKGAAMLSELRGMFAFGIWDNAERSLFLARDPYGIKPLYYADDGRTLRFASQVKALMAGGALSRDPDPAGIVGFYLFGSVPEPYTRHRAVRALPAGHWLRLGDQGADTPGCYFSLSAALAEAAGPAAPASADGLAASLRAALTDSVRHHMVADVPVAAFLSAGVDSATLVALMAEAGDDRLQTVTLAFEEYRGRPDDESPLAEQIAQRYATAHSRRVITERDFSDSLPAILAAMDQPSIDGINTWLVSRAARELGLKVAVSGLGGDELFGGYPSFRDIPRWVSRFAAAGRAPLLGRSARRLFAALSRWLPGVSPKAGGLMEYGGSYAGAYLLRRGLFMPWELPSLIGAELAHQGLSRLQPLAHIARAMQPDPGTAFARVAALESGLYMRNQLLRDADWAGMSHSLEIRVPLVDATLLRALAGPLLHAPALDGDGKRLLAQTPRRALPAAVVERPKTGFTVPTARWIERVEPLQGWRKAPLLRRPGCHWSRRLAYALADGA